MKNLVVVAAFSLISFTCFASSTCYVAKTSVPAGAPKAICLRALEVNSDTGSVVLNTDLEDTIVKNLQLISFVRHNEERAQFVASLPLMEYGDLVGCGEGATVSANISGQVDTTKAPAINVNALSVSVSYYYFKDSCHSSGEEQIIDYSLAK